MVKKKDLSKFSDKAPDIRDLEIQSRLNKLSEKNEFFNRSSNNNFFPPNLPPSPLGPPLLPPPSDLLNMFQGSMNFLITMTLILAFPTVMFHQHPIHHRLGDSREIFFPNRPSMAITLSNVGPNKTQTISGMA